MKKITLLCTALAFSLSAMTVSVNAADKAKEDTTITKLTPAAIAVVDLQKLQEGSTAYKGLTKQLEKYMSDLKAEASKEEAALRKMEQDINKERATLTQDEFNKKVESFRTKMMEFQQKYQAKQEAIYESFAKAGNKLQSEALNPAISEVAEKKGAGLIASSQMVMQFDPKFDITQEVLVLMNKKLPKITMEKPKTAAAKK